MEEKILLDKYDIVNLLKYLLIQLIDDEKDDIVLDEIDILNIQDDIFR
jgi:hypothetical protein